MFNSIIKVSSFVTSSCSKYGLLIKSTSVFFKKSTNFTRFSVFTQSSPSTTLKYLPVASRIPRLIVEPCPPFSFSITRIVCGYFSCHLVATSTVLSLEPSLTTRISMSSTIALSSKKGIHSSIYFSVL